MGKSNAPFNKVRTPLETIWQVPDGLWAEIKQVLDEVDPPKKTGRPRIDARRALDGIIFRLRTSCQSFPGRTCRKSSGMTPLCTARSSAGWRRECSHGSGRSS